MIFFVKIGILVFHVHLEIFCNIFFPDQCQNSVKCFQVWSNMLLKIIQIHSLNLLNFVRIVVFDVETTLLNPRFQSEILDSISYMIFLSLLRSFYYGVNLILLSHPSLNKRSSCGLILTIKVTPIMRGQLLQIITKTSSTSTSSAQTMSA